MSHLKKSLPFPLTMFESQKKKLNKKALDLEVNRSWLARLFIDYGYRNMTDHDIMALAGKDIDSTPRRKFKK